MKIAVVTAAIGLKNIELYDPSYSSAEYFIFTDSNEEFSNWNKIRAFPGSLDSVYEARRCGKIPKILTHYLLPEYDYYIWHDYTHKVAIEPKDIITEHLGSNDFAFFKHPLRSSWDTELDEVLKSNIDDKNRLLLQKEYYTTHQIQKNKNFYACTCIVRKNNEIANKTCSLWYDHVSQFSSRDQISLPAAIQRYNPKVTLLPGDCQFYYSNNKIIPQIRHSLRVQGLVK